MIQPYRRGKSQYFYFKVAPILTQLFFLILTVIQEVRPVQESIHTIVSKGEPRGGGAGGAGGGSVGNGGAAGGLRSSSAAYGRSQQSSGGNGGLNIGYSEQQPIYSSQAAPMVSPRKQQVHHQVHHQMQQVHHHPQQQFTRRYLLPAASQYSPQYAIPQYLSRFTPSSTREMPTHYSPRY